MFRASERGRERDMYEGSIQEILGSSAGKARKAADFWELENLAKSEIMEFREMTE